MGQGNHDNRKGELRKGERVTNYAKQRETDGYMNC